MYSELKEKLNTCPNAISLNLYALIDAGLVKSISFMLKNIF